MRPLSHAHAIALMFTLLPGAPLADVIKMSDGRSVTTEGFQIETQNGSTVKTLILNMTPDFDPEPNGEVPSDDYARVHEALCNVMVKNNADAVRSNGITRFRALWKWTPVQKPENVAAGITITRSHQSEFEVQDDLTCFPVPNEVRPEDVRTTTPTGLDVRVRYIETNRENGNLDMIYELDRPMSEASNDLLRNSAIELCILQADGVLAHRAKYYQQLAHSQVAIIFDEQEPTNTRKSYRFSVENAECKTGLSPTLVDSIRQR